METVDTAAPFVNGAHSTVSIEDVIAWARAQVTKGDMGASSGTVRITALNQMLGQVAEGEPRDAASVLANMDRLRERWARKNSDKEQGTAQAYATRARTTIEAYLRWAKAPDKYKPNEPRPRQPKADASPAPIVAPFVEAPKSPPATMTGEGERNFPLGEGRGAILFTLPPGGVTFADVRKFAVHLFTLASDFNITDADQARTFAMVVRGETT